jgi:hypothetical protein
MTFPEVDVFQNRWTLEDKPTAHHYMYAITTLVSKVGNGFVQICTNSEWYDQDVWRQFLLFFFLDVSLGKVY